MAKETEPVILAIDLGTSGMKTALITISGKVLGWEIQSIRLHLTADGGVEQDPEEWWQALIKCSHRLLAKGIVPTSSVIAVCCSTQGEGTIPVDSDGKPLMNCVLWMDMRGQADLLREHKGVLNINGMSAVKVLKWIKLTGGIPSASGKDPAAHMLFIRNHQPEI
jgi:xylulokinase